ncbi:MAG: hypothetical protein PVH65_13350 [Chloroflexota bacterium]
MAEIDDQQAPVDDVDRPSEEARDQSPSDQEKELRSRPLFRVIGIILIALAVVIGVYGTVAYLAWQRSQQAQGEEERALLMQEIDQQLVLADQDMAAGNLGLAQRRLEWILQRAPDHAAALGLLSEIESRLALPTPTPRPTPTQGVVVDGESPAEDDLTPAFERLQQLVEDGSWSAAISALIAFQSEHPNYRRLETDRLLYDAYVNLGQELLPGEQVELGLYYLSQAEALGDLKQEVLDQRLWAELYLSGIAYYGVDWETAAYFFRDLCAAAPFYQESCQKLRVALTSLGDIDAANLDWCPAEAFYAEAAAHNGDAELSEKLANARLMCLEATPTPTAPITATQGVSDTLPISPTEDLDGGGQGIGDG